MPPRPGPERQTTRTKDGKEMAENERPSGIAIINAIRTQRQSGGTTDRSNLGDTLVKSSQWKKNALQRIEAKSAIQSPTLQDHVDEIERLQQRIAELEAENARLIAQRRNILEAQKIELLELQHAYDQFQQESDLLLTELDQENRRLRIEMPLIN
jgi:uncharacterized small protein (DUF1192 family)